MKRYNIYWAFMVLVCQSQQVVGQTVDWFTGGNTSLNPATSFLGTTDGVPINYRTNNLLRARLYPTQTSNFNTNYPAVQQDGFFALSGTPNFFTNAASPGAFSRLHLVDPAISATAPAFYAPTAAYRNWMRNGITFSGNADMGYIGQRYNGNDRSDMVIHWSNDAGTMAFAPDRLRFLFTTAQDGATSGATSLAGLEAVRFYPPRNNEVYMGLGDFFAGNLVDPTNIAEPTERFDVLNGRIRFRDLPGSPANNTLNKVLVVDDAALPSGERGVIKWRDASTLWTADCRWRMNTGANNHLFTAFGAADPNCPDNGDAVAIGLDLTSIPAPNGKLTVLTNNRRDAIDVAQVSTTALANGINIQVSGPTTTTRGVNITTYQGTINDAGIPGSPLSYGVHVNGVAAGNSAIGYNFGYRAQLSGANRGTRGVQIVTDGASHQAVGGDFHCYDNANQNFAVVGQSYNGVLHTVGVQGTSTANATNNYGVQGVALGTNNRTYYGVSGVASSTHADGVAYGVYGSASGPDNTAGLYGHTKWAGYFPGYTYTPGALWTASDEQLKQNIEDLSSEQAVEKLMQLVPKTYDFNQDQFAFMHLPTEHQYGLIAQNVREVFPELVTNIHQPARLDSAGMEVDPAVDFTAMNYQGLVPVLIAGFKQQQVNTMALQDEVAQLQDRLMEMEHLLAACCANPDRALPQPGSDTVIPAFAGMTPGGEKLRIQPNPFNERTTVSYKLDNGGRTQLMANSADGKELRVLHEATMEKGDYQYEWNTAALAPGMYYVTLLVDGQPLVKKAVKVDR